jgi:trk system potassium uptake protein TrkH
MPSGSALFETVSALGTVGLSIGGTASLDTVGKAAIVVAMFAGRVGPLTLFLFLASRRTTPRAGLPEKAVVVG